MSEQPDSPPPAPEPPGRGPRPLPLAARARRLHGLLAPVVLAPLLLTVGSGMGYRLLRDWGGFSRDQVHLLMMLHEGEWLGPWGKSFYVLANGAGLLWMLATGAVMAWQRLRRG